MYLFTDGSCVEDSQYVGFAAISYDGYLSPKMGGFCLFILCQSNGDSHGSGTRI